MDTDWTRTDIASTPNLTQIPAGAAEHTSSNLGQLNAIVMSAMDAIISVDAAQRVILFNPASEKMFGWSAAEMLGQSLERLIPPHLASAHRAHIHAFGETGVTTRAMGKLTALSGLHKDGTAFPVEASISQVESETGKIFTVILRDITKQHAAQLALAQSEHRFRALVESSFDAVALLDARGVILYGSPSTPQILGYTLAEFVGQNADDLVHPQDQPELEYCLQQVLAQPRVGIPISPRVRHKDGTWRHMEGILTNLLDEPGVEAIVSNYRDITERTQHQDAIRSNAARLTSILESAMDAIITVDEEQKIILFNAAAEKMFECLAHQVLGTQLERFIPARYRLAHAAHIKRFAETGITNRKMGALVPLTALRQDGSEFPIEASISQVNVGSTKLFTVILRDVTERNQVEAQLVYQANLIASVSDAIISTDTEFLVRSWNRAAESIYGWRADEVLGKTVTQLLDTQYLDGGWEAALAALRDTGMWKGEVLQKRRDGSRVEIYSAAAVLQDSESKPAGLVVVNRDVSVLKRVEAELRRSEQVLKLFVEHAPAAIAMFDRTMKYIAVSRRFISDYQLGKQDILGRSHYDIFPDIPERWREIHRNCLAGATAHADEDAFQRADGSIDYIRWEIRAWHEASGEVGGLILFSEVITDRKLAAQELQLGASRAQAMSWLSNALSIVSPDLRAVLDTTVDRIGRLMGDLCSIGLVSGDGEWVDTVALYHRDSKILAAMQELTRAERVRVGEPITGLVAATGKPLLIPRLDPAILDTAALPERQHFFKANPLSSILLVPLFGQGRVIGVLGLGRLNPDQPYTSDDEAFLEELAGRVALAIANARLFGQVELELTERAKAEQALQELNEQLEQRVAERTVQLEYANKELEAFSYSVSHDLRAPLRAIDGFAHILLRDNATDLNPKTQRYLGVIRNNTQQMGRLIDDLLSFSRLNRQTVAAKPVNMGELVHAVMRELRSEIEGRYIEFHIVELGMCLCDAAMLKQAWVNLITNAFKYTRTRALAKIEIARTEVNGESVYSIKDNGVGFDMKYVDKLFGVFQRLHRAEEYEGTGVGLAIVQRIVHRHGGRVWAEAQVDAGATFYFTLGTEPESKGTS